MEITSGILSVRQFTQEVEAFFQFLQDKEIGSVTAMYGWGCEVDEPYTPINVSDVRGFFRQAVSENVWELGFDDLHIQVPELGAEFLFCHESDIHVMSDTDEVLVWWRSRWLTQGYSVNESQNGAL